jgi:uronate dehydrogenase
MNRHQASTLLPSEFLDRLVSDAMSKLGPILLTGAAGRIGSSLRAPLRAAASELRLTDVSPLRTEASNEIVHQADLTDFAAMCAAADGAEAIVHLGAVPVEAPFDELAAANLTGCYHVFEAARLGGVRRVVFASSNHATGFYPVDQRLTGDEPTRPDSLYGVTKVYGEALGRLYHDKFGLEVACLRIGTFKEQPTEPRTLHTWLSVPDATRLVLACLTSPDLGFAILYGVSDNRRSWWSNESASRLGYVPEDDAEAFAAEIGDLADGLPQGGFFAAPERHATR